MNNKLFESFYYVVSPSSFSKTHCQVKVFYIYKSKKIIKSSLLIKKTKTHNDDQYYINKAKAIIYEMMKNNELEKEAEKYLKQTKKKKILRIALPLIGVCALAGTTVGVYFATHQIPFKEDAENMINAYQVMLTETTDTSYYHNKTFEQILQDQNRPLKEATINGIKTYYFTDIDYNDLVTRDDNWPAKDHVYRAREIAVCSYKNNQPELMDVSIKLLEYWVFTDHRSSNWWWNEIGANDALTDAAMYCFDIMPECVQEALLGRIEQSSFYYRPALKTHTGANLVDFAKITLKSSLLRKNRDEFEVAVTRMEEEITDENVEGFQKDGEFFQHGCQVNTTSSYGRSVFRMGYFMRIVSVSKLRKFRQDKLAIISRFILDGLAPATHKGFMNYLTMGREYTREGHLVTRTNQFPDIKNFYDAPGMPQVDKIKEYVNHLDNHESTFSGLRYFDLGRMIMINTDDLYISFKGTADYIVNTECNNEENKLGLNLSYGTNTCVMDDGAEYNNIVPTWDYAYMPGTTSYQLGNIDDLDVIEDGYSKYLYDSDKMMADIKDPSKKYYQDGMYDKHLPTATNENGYYYGGGYDQENGVAYLMQRSCHHRENNFTVTCIATKDGMVILGADLGYTGSITEDGILFEPNSRKLHTTIQQAFAKPNETFLSDNSTELTFGNAFYRTLDGSKIETLKTNIETVVKGHWKRNHKPSGSDLATTSRIFSAFINHGDNRTDAKYAYSIQHKNHQNEKFELVHNFDGNKVQEVKLPNGLYAIASYEKINNYQTAKGEIINLEKGDFKIL